MGTINKSIKIIFSHTENTKASVFINNKLVFNDLLANRPEWFEVEDYQDHFIRINVICHEGEVSVGLIESNFCQDMNPSLTLEQRQELFNDRINDIPTKIDNPYVYYKNSDSNSDFPMTKRLIPDERLHFSINGKHIDTSKPTGDPCYTSWAGWCFTVNQDEVLSFDVNVLVPADLLQFINDFNLGEKYFNEVLPTEF